VTTNIRLRSRSNGGHSGAQTRSRAWQKAYRPLRRRTLLLQLGWLTGAEIALFQVYGRYDSRFHWAAHFLVAVIATAAWLSARLLVTSAPARGQIIVVLGFHLYAMAPDLLFRVGVPHALWMNVFLGHIAVHYLPGGDRAWLALALLSAAGYASLLSLWLKARTVEAVQGMAPGIGIGGSAVLRPQRRPESTELAHQHTEPPEGASTDTGPVFVLIHGLGATAAFWEPVAAELAAAGHSSLRPDLLGHGASLHIGTVFDLDTQARALLRLLDHHAADRVRLVAHSYGCAVAVSVANMAPDRIAELQLISPPAFADPETARTRLGHRSWLARTTLEGAPVAGVMCGLMCLARAPLSHLIPSEARGLPTDVAVGTLQHSFPAYRDGIEALFRNNPLATWFAKPGVPTRIVLPDQDLTFPPGDALELPGVAQLDVVHHAGSHHLPLEHPASLAAVLLAPQAGVP
jgi:pimeloyl-ACP methyl ester carboxylesterase